MTRPVKESEATRDSKKQKQPKIKRKLMKPNNLINIYAVYQASDTKHSHPITFTATREQALQAVDQFIFYQQFAHFKRWCPLHDLSVNHEESWHEYCDTVLAEQYANDELSDYIILEYYYTRDEISSILRMFALCTPLNLDYEHDEEYTYYQDVTAKDKPTDLDNAIADVAATFQELHDKQDIQEAKK